MQEVLPKKSKTELTQNRCSKLSKTKRTKGRLSNLLCIVSYEITLYRRLIKLSSLYVLYIMKSPYIDAYYVLYPMKSPYIDAYYVLYPMKLPYIDA